MLFVAKTIWCLGVVGWLAIRSPHYRLARRTAKVRIEDRVRELILRGIATTGLVIVPASYVFGKAFRFADYPIQVWSVWLGAATFAAALWLFHRTHRDLGRNWSVTLEVRERHSLIDRGVYRRVRHPMYAAFWLWSVAQALLLPNWVAGSSALVGFGTLYFFRVGREERMMLDTFGEEYRCYMERTWRILPGVF